MDIKDPDSNTIALTNVNVLRGSLRGFLFLALVLNVLFFPVLWGDRTLMLSSDGASIFLSGAFGAKTPPMRFGRTPDPGAPGWTIEPWFKAIATQYWQDHTVPLWNPYAAYGKPLAAAQQPQPFYPLTLLLSLHLSPKTFDFFYIGRLFIAGFLMFLFARLFLDSLPSLAAALTYMLSGYFMFMLAMPHISVEVLAPGILLTFESILRRNTWRSVCVAAALIFCSVVGGMPESLFLSVAFGCLYFLFRLLAEETFRARARGRLTKLVIALMLGFGLSAFLLLPFVELLPIAHDSHQAFNRHGSEVGLVATGTWRDTVLYLLPLLFGPIGNSILGNLSAWDGMWGYWGVVPCLLAVVTIARSLQPADWLYPKSWRRLNAFFTLCLVVMLLKRTGNPLVNWIGALPVFDEVLYAKYDEPLMALCVAMLAGMGFALVIEQRVRPYYLPFAAIAVTTAMLALLGLWLPAVLELRRFSWVFYSVATCGVLLVL